MSVRYIDAHCHLQFDQYADDGDSLVSAMEAQGVAGIVVGCDLESSKRAIALAEKHEHLFASVGLHPNHEPDEQYDTGIYHALARHPKVVAIGECGLDFFRPQEVTPELKEKQKELLQKQVELAAEIRKPLIIHSRPSKGTADAYEGLIEILSGAKKKHSDLQGDIHFFVGGVAEAQALSALGFTLSFTAVITFARDYDEVIRSIPIESLLAETDAPYVAPEGRRGKRNDPLAIIDVVEKIAVIRDEDPEYVRAALLANTRELFSLPKGL